MNKDVIRILYIDASRRQTKIVEKKAEEATLKEKLGGFGQAVEIIDALVRKRQGPINAYDPANSLVINLGFLSGSSVTAARRTFISGISPLKTSKEGTNGIYYSTASGNFGPMMRSQGIDSIVITGESAEPVYLLVRKSRVEFLSAADIIGCTTEKKIRTLAAQHDNAAFAVIGPAGEKKVRFANIAVSTVNQLKKGSKHMRFSGRGGFGAVLGSKNILGVVVPRGDERMRTKVKAINREIAANPKSNKYREHGTFFANIKALNKLSVGIVDNFSRPGSELVRGKTEDLYMANLEKLGYRINNKGCQGCAVKCWKVVVDQDNKVLGKIDYEPGSLLGPNLGIFDIREIMELNNIGDRNGLDTISLGVVIGFEMERLGKFGDFALARKLALKIARGEHPFSEGLARCAGDDPGAMHVKGMELAAYMGNYNPGYAFAIAAPHTSMDTYNRAWYQGATNDLEEWTENIIRGPKILLYDMAGICKFAKPSLKNIIALYNEYYNEKIDQEELLREVYATYFIARDIDAKLGFTEDDDVLPERCHQDLGGGIAHFNTKEFFNKLKTRVYEEFQRLQVQLGL